VAYNKIGNEKRLADCVESLLGAYLVAGGEKMAARFMNLLNQMYLQAGTLDNSDSDEETETKEDVLVCPPAQLWPSENESKSTVIDQFHAQFDDLREPTPPELKQINIIEQELKYTFKNKKIARLAITMHGFNKKDKLDSNERLEFLGDAVLDYLVVDEFYNKRKNQQRFNSGQLTDLKQAITSNNVFGSLAFTLFLPHQAYTSDPKKLYQLEYFKLQLATVDGIPLNPDLARVMNVYGLPEKALDSEYFLDVPKWFGDLYEALFGAIWLDCDQSLHDAWQIIRENLEPVMGLDEADNADSHNYLEALNPIRRLMTPRYSNGNPPVFHPPKAKPVRTVDEIINVIGQEYQDEKEYLAKLACHLDKCFVRVSITKSNDDTVTTFGIGYTEASARFNAATRLLLLLAN